jgi:hypothetical protein
MQITLDKPRNLRFNVNSLAWLEEALCEPGQSGGTFLAQFLETLKAGQFPGFRTMRALLWACLRQDDKTLTLEQAGELLPTSRVAEVFEKCLTVMNDFFAEGNHSPLSEDSAGLSGGVSAATISDSPRQRRTH